MGSVEMWHWMIVLVGVLVVLDGGGKITTLMGDVAKGIKSFKKHMADDEALGEQAATRNAGGDIAPPPVATAAETRAPADQSTPR